MIYVWLGCEIACPDMVTRINSGVIMWACMRKGNEIWISNVDFIYVDWKSAFHIHI